MFRRNFLQAIGGGLAAFLGRGRRVDHRPEFPDIGPVQRHEPLNFVIKDCTFTSSPSNGIRFVGYWTADPA